jgi:hypothetical protein
MTQGLHRIKIAGNTVIPVLYVIGVIYSNAPTYPAAAFVMQWRGTGLLTLPTPTVSAGVYSINWGDGVTDSNTRTHTYSGPRATYTIQITGNNLTSVKPFTSALTSNIVSMPQIGYTLTNMFDMFSVCNTISAQVQRDMASWNTSNVTDMSETFQNTLNFDGDVSNWNTSKVTNMSTMFLGATSFNKPLNWNTINVQNMSDMFVDTYAFNQPLGHFNTSNVVNMSQMFNGSGMSDTNYDTLKTWNVSKCTEFFGMFKAQMSNKTMSNILAGWATYGVLSGEIFGVNINQRAIGFTICIPPGGPATDIQTYYTSRNWFFFSQEDDQEIPIATFFSATS